MVFGSVTFSYTESLLEMKDFSPQFVCVCVCVCACSLSLFSRVQLFAIPWTVAHQAPLSMGFSRLEYWSGLPCPPGELPGLEMEPVSPEAFALQPDSLQLSHQGSPWICNIFIY